MRNSTKTPSFQQAVPGIYRLEIPFSNLWTGVFLVVGQVKVLIDSGHCPEDVEGMIQPAMRQLGLQLADIDYLACTHCHGDHVGGHFEISKQSYAKVVCYHGSAQRLRDPLAYSKAIRARFPAHSPPAPDSLRGVEPQLLLEDGDKLGGFLRLVYTPGHDTDAVSWLDERTGTLITGDSLQLQGTISQGTALMMDLAAYRQTLRRLQAQGYENILAGHPYLPLGAEALGNKAAMAYLDSCAATVALYESVVRFTWHQQIRDPVEVARRLIACTGGAVPEYLFLPLYTATQYLEQMM